MKAEKHISRLSHEPAEELLAEFVPDTSRADSIVSDLIFLDSHIYKVYIIKMSM